MHNSGEPRCTWTAIRRLGRWGFWISLAVVVTLMVLVGFVAQDPWLTVLGTLGSWLLGVGAASLLSAITSDIALWWLRGPIRWGRFSRQDAKLAYVDGVLSNYGYGAPGVWFIRVGFRQRTARTGAAHSVREAHGGRSSSWFRNAWPRTGQVLLARGGYGQGHYWSDGSVLYVSDPGIRLPVWAWKAYRRRLRRDARAERRAHREWAKEQRQAQRAEGRKEKQCEVAARPHLPLRQAGTASLAPELSSGDKTPRRRVEFVPTAEAIGNDAPTPMGEFKPSRDG